jgi:type I restriction-modification system DNA methylase subunit
LTPRRFPRTIAAVPTESRTKEKFFATLAGLVALAKDFPTAAFDEAAPEETTKHKLIRPLLKSLGYDDANLVPEFKIVGDQVDYLLKSDRPLLFVEAKSLIDVSVDLFEGHKQQVLGYIRNYRVSPEQAQMERPVTWIVLSNFKEWHFIRVTEERPSFSFKLNELIPRREELWELLARENVEASRIEELYDQSHKADLDKRFLADLKRWRLLIANGYALRNQQRPLDDITLASQQLLDRFIFCRMLETHRLIEWNKLARTFTHYDEVSGGFEGKPFAEFLREWLFREIKHKFNTELFHQPLLCDELAIDNEALATVIGHEPLHAELAAHCGIATQGELFPFRHLYLYDFSKMSQDIMGAVYERFLAHKLFPQDGRVVIEDTDELRKKEGIYYTPRYIVDYIVAHTLGEKIKPILAEALTLLGYKSYKAAAQKIRELANLKVLDPAMGSGSFLLRAFDKLVEAYAEYNAAARKAKADRANGSGMLFDAAGEMAEEIDHLGIRVATENIFGVDLDTQAIEVAKLNLWMRLMAVESDFIRAELQKRGKASRPMNFLPDLRKNLRRGNSLIADKAVAGDAAFDWRKEFPDMMGSTGDPPVPVGDPPTGTGRTTNLKPTADSQKDAPSHSAGLVAQRHGQVARATQARRGGFDVVIGNPPYERIQTMMGNAPQAVEFLKANYRSAASGNFDIYVCFIERGLQLLKNDGHFGFICPHKFFQAEYGEPLRKLLDEGKHVRHILSFGDLQIFPQVSTYTCLLFLDKEPQPACRFVKVESLDNWRATGIAPEGEFPAEHLAASEWNFALGAAAPLFERLSKLRDKFADVTERVFQGPITSADKVFLFEEHRAAGKKDVTEVFSPESEAWVALESKLLKRVVRSGSVGRYWSSATALVLFPYEVKDNEAKLIPAAKLQKSFPLAWDYLSRHKKLLEGRENGSFHDDQWFRFGRTQNLGLWEQPKLLVPYMITELGAHLDRDENLYFINVTTGGYGVTVDTNMIRLPYLCGLLNSRLLNFYLKQVSTNFRGGYFAANKQFLDKLPIKLVEPKRKAEAKLEKEIVERVERIQEAHRQRVKLPEVLHRLIHHSQDRTPCNLAHYLQRDFAEAVKPEILIDDVQRNGFVHEISVTASRSQLMLSATVADDLKSDPKPLPILRLDFKHEPLRQFIYALWKQFLEENSRKKKWTTGKKPDAIYSLLVNTLEPLVYFQPAATDNLRLIRDLMKEVEKEAGSADLAALEAEIERLDGEIDERVYDLYGLTPEEKAIVQGSRA